MTKGMALCLLSNLAFYSMRLLLAKTKTSLVSCCVLKAIGHGRKKKKKGDTTRRSQYTTQYATTTIRERDVKGGWWRGTKLSLHPCGWSGIVVVTGCDSWGSEGAGGEYHSKIPRKQRGGKSNLGWTACRLFLLSLTFGRTHRIACERVPLSLTPAHASGNGYLL